MNTNIEKGRIVFLDHLRGLACLMVVFGHVYLMGVNDFATTSVWLPFVKGPVFGPDSPVQNPFKGFTTWLVLDAGISLGALGVGVFFLISGYIILRTVDREIPSKFLVLRAFRIFPLATFVSIGVAVVTALLCLRYGGENPHSIGSVIATSFAAPGFVGTFSTIPVIWSLAVEIVFYMLMAVAAAAFGRIELGHIAGLSAVCAALSIASQLADVRASFPPSIGGALVTLGYCAFHASFLLIGSALYRCNLFGLHTARSLAWLALMAGIYAASLYLSVTIGSVAGTGTTWQVGTASCVIFLAAMIFKTRPIRVLTFFGDISYPLYLLHVPAAWAIMFMLGARGYGMHASTLTALAACILMSWVLHYWVEIPAHNLGKLLVGSPGEPSPSAR